MLKTSEPLSPQDKEIKEKTDEMVKNIMDNVMEDLKNRNKINIHSVIRFIMFFFGVPLIFILASVLWHAIN